MSGPSCQNDDVNDTNLSAAVQDAQRLLNYASAKGIGLDEALVSDVVDARKLIGADKNDTSTFDLQKKFWKSLALLTVATAPASISSIQYTATTRTTLYLRLWAKLTRSQPECLPVGEIAVRRAGVIALISLFVVAVMLAYVEIGSTTIHDYSANLAKYERNQRMLPPAVSGAQPSEADVARRVENGLLREQTERQLLIMQMIIPWKLTGDPGTPEYAQAVMATTEWLLIVLRGFLLPALWGLIGAALYVSRTLADDLGNMSYTQDQATLHRSRYFLGAVAGFVVAKFSTVLSGRTSDDVIQPFVLALLVGYSVDLLFTLLNKLISTFTSKS